MPAFTSVQVAWPDSPTPYSAWVMVTWPTALPISTVAMTSASQAPTAASRCRALHPPSVAARLGRPAITHRQVRARRVHARPCALPCAPDMPDKPPRCSPVLTSAIRLAVKVSMAMAARGAT